MRELKISVGEVEIRVELFDTPTADAILANVPFESRASIWGEEVYFATPVSVPAEPDARTAVEPERHLARLNDSPRIRLDGDSIAIGFGPTPIAQGDEIRLASPANIWGRALDDVRLLASVRAGAPIWVTAVA